MHAHTHFLVHVTEKIVLLLKKQMVNFIVYKWLQYIWCTYLKMFYVQLTFEVFMFIIIETTLLLLLGTLK